MAKKLTKEVTETGVTITFANGEVLALNFDSLSDDIKFKLMGHGASQKLGDASAGTETVEEAIAETKKVLERLIAGDWKSVRESGASPKIGLLVEALARLTQRDVGECFAVVEGMDDETKKKLRAHPQLKAVMADIRAEREKAKARDAGVSATDFGALFS
jgi:hypothetical protein